MPDAVWVRLNGAEPGGCKETVSPLFHPPAQLHYMPFTAQHSQRLYLHLSSSHRRFGVCCWTHCHLCRTTVCSFYAPASTYLYIGDGLAMYNEIEKHEKNTCCALSSPRAGEGKPGQSGVTEIDWQQPHMRREGSEPREERECWRGGGGDFFSSCKIWLQDRKSGERGRHQQKYELITIGGCWYPTLTAQRATVWTVVLFT